MSIIEKNSYKSQLRKKKKTENKTKKKKKIKTGKKYFAKTVDIQVEN